MVSPERYDDGGFSGGNTERPGLQRLLADVDAGKVQVIAVYKLDRLSVPFDLLDTATWHDYRRQRQLTRPIAEQMPL